MSKAYGRRIASAVLAAAMLAMCADIGAALPSARVVTEGDSNSPVVRVHGFHCRRELGWDARAGVYHYHRHEGICKNYQRCMQEHRRCSILLGRGWGPWEIERWGFDNWRYTDCMMHRGCY